MGKILIHGNRWTSDRWHLEGLPSEHCEEGNGNEKAHVILGDGKFI